MCIKFRNMEIIPSRIYKLHKAHRMPQNKLCAVYKQRIAFRTFEDFKLMYGISHGGKFMFENKRRQRSRNIVFLIVALVLLGAFSFGYYLNYGGDKDISKNTTYNNDPSGYRIPDSIKNPTPTVPGAVIPQVEAQEPTNDTTNVNASTDNFITPNTKVILKTYFTLCSHMLDAAPEDSKGLVNMTQEQLSSKYPDWTIKEFSPQQVILTREKQTYCPRHYIIGIDDSGTYIAIYKYDAEGKKTLNEVTETTIATLTPEDQKSLQYGIVADSEDELQQKLEGFSE